MKFLVIFFLVLGCALALPRQRRGAEEKSAAITNQEFKSDPDGNFEYNYETQNGISARALGAPKTIQGNPPETAEVIQGTFSWTSPEGKVVNVQYTADENGYYPKVQL